MTDKINDVKDPLDYVNQQQTKQRVKDNVQNIGDSLSNNLSDSLDELKRYARQSGRRMRRWLRGVGDQANLGVENIESSIRARPFLSTTAAFAVGILASKLMTSRK